MAYKYQDKEKSQKELETELNLLISDIVKSNEHIKEENIDRENIKSGLYKELKRHVGGYSGYYLDKIREMM